MSNDEVKGKAKRIKGDIREGVGKLTNNKAEQVKGKIEQIEGAVQEGIGKQRESPRNELFNLKRRKRSGRWNIY